ncbi:apolipoprotein N-acyltransferase [Microbacterium resistens]|uniref:apolipoprotein N-acyltransferase n=1 Tax=Microbacterium resistens TaxID=156977 RepID=UPI001F41ECEA|nr:apolipoprotein N-acyltransferase [Microbacterium resistens]
MSSRPMRDRSAPDDTAPDDSAPADRAEAPPVPLWLAVVLAACAGGLLTLAFPQPAVWGLSFVAVAMLLVALIGRRTWSALLVGSVFGIVFFVLLVSWTGTYLGPIPWVALGVLEGVLTGVGLIPVTLAYRWIPRAVRRPAVRALALAGTVGALWIGRELFVGTWPYGGFPWARIGLTMTDTNAAHLASWVGVSGLGFVVVAFVALVVEIVRDRPRAAPRPRLLPTLSSLLLLILLVAVPLFPTTPAGSMRIGAVQGNGPAGFFDEREPYAVIDAQISATRELRGEDMDLLVWPEGGVDGDPFEGAALASALNQVVRGVDAPLLGNAATGKGERFYNTSFLWPKDMTGTPSRSETQTHAKRHPVPFGEYVPDRAFYNAIVPDLIGLLQREYTPGDDAPLVRVGERTVGLAICFDVIYDEVIREGIYGGAVVFVFQTNNADFRGTAENLQQLAIARMRAIETGRSVVNISTVGTSQIIRPDGSTVSTVDADRPGVLLEDVELRTGATGGVVVGPYLEQLLLWGGLLGVVVAGLSARRRRVG